MKKDERGVITLEACITVFAFLILMLLLSSLFVMFMAQNAMAHATLQTAESLSLDVYRTETIGLLDGKISPIGSYVSQFVFGWFGKPEDNPNFITDDCWYTDQDKVAHRNRQIKNGFEEEPEEYQTDELTQTVKTRFLGYLCGNVKFLAHRHSFYYLGRRMQNVEILYVFNSNYSHSIIFIIP